MEPEIPPPKSSTPTFVAPFTCPQDFQLENFSTLGINIHDYKTYIYHFANNAEDTSDFKTCSIIPNKVPNAIYPHETARPIYPVFLRQHFQGTTVPMEVFVKRMGKMPGYPVIILRAPTESILKKLHDLIHQWLSRPDDDKVTMQKAQPLPQNRDALLRLLRDKFAAFVDRKIPPMSSDSLQVVQSLKNELDSLLQDNSQVEPPAELLDSLLDVKYKCVVATYKYLLTDAKVDTLTSFCDFFKTIEALRKSTVTPEMMMTAVLYLLEIFTPHMSTTVTSAMKTWTKEPMLDMAARKVYQDRYDAVYQRIARKTLPPQTSGGPEGDAEILDEENSDASMNSPEDSIDMNDDSQSVGADDPQMPDGDVTRLSTTESGEKNPLIVAARLKAHPLQPEARIERRIHKMTELNLRLGLPADAPIGRDPRNFTRAEVRKWVAVGQDVIKNQRLLVMAKDGSESNGELRDALNENCTKPPRKHRMVNLWNCIRIAIQLRNL